MPLIKEFRLPLPLSVEECRNGLRFANWKTNTLHKRSDQGGELVESRFFSDERHGDGFYTHTLYRLGDRLPLWLNKLLPASALVLHEKTWNAYPRLRTTITTPLFQHLHIEILSNHLPGDGQGVDNALALDEPELAQRTVDFIDLAVDKVGKGDYRPELDPCLVSSQKTGRGPFAPGWQATTSPIMCAYKLVKVTADYWGVGPRVEKFVLSSMRELFLLTHGNAVCMLDEWISLTSDQIDELVGIASAPAVKDTMLPPLPATDDETQASVDILREGELTVEPVAEEGGGSGRGSSIIEESGFDLEEDDTVFYEADEVSWDSMAESHVQHDKRESDKGADVATSISNPVLRVSGSVTWSAELAPASENDRLPTDCGVCQALGQAVRAALYCVNCGEAFCRPCEAKWHVSIRLQLHLRHPVANGAVTRQLELALDPKAAALDDSTRASRREASVGAEPGGDQLARMPRRKSVLNLPSEDRSSPDDAALLERFQGADTDPCLLSCQVLELLMRLYQQDSASSTPLSIRPADDVYGMSGPCKRELPATYSDAVVVAQPPKLDAVQGTQAFAEYWRAVQSLAGPNLPLSRLDRRGLLTFWINVYNATLLHAIMAWGAPRSALTRFGFMKKAALCVAGCRISALEMEHAILRCKSQRPMIRLSGLLPDSLADADAQLRLPKLESPEPRVSFALCPGTRSGPLLQVYRPDTVEQQLKAACREYCALAIGIDNGAVRLPKILRWYARDFSKDGLSLLAWVSHQLPAEEGKVVQEYLSSPASKEKTYSVAPYDWNFRYIMTKT